MATDINSRIEGVQNVVETDAARHAPYRLRRLEDRHAGRDGEAQAGHHPRSSPRRDCEASDHDDKNKYIADINLKLQCYSVDEQDRAHPSIRPFRSPEADKLSREECAAYQRSISSIMGTQFDDEKTWL